MTVNAVTKQQNPEIVVNTEEHLYNTFAHKCFFPVLINTICIYFIYTSDVLIA